MFKVLHVAAKRHLLRMGREEGGGSRERGGVWARLWPKHPVENIYLCNRKKLAPKEEDETSSLTEIDFALRRGTVSRQQGSTYQALGSPPSPPRCTLRPCAHASNIRTFPATNLPIDKRGSSKSVCVWGGNSVWVLAKWTFRANFDFMFATQFMGLWVC